MPRLTVRGAELEVREDGAGEPIVLVHGTASDLRSWNRLHESLAGRFRAIAYSRRYHWPNEPIAAGRDYAMVEQVDDLLALLRSLDATPAHLVGHSYGAYLALLAALREPGVARTLILGEPPVLPLVLRVPPTRWELLRLVLTRPLLALSVIRFAKRGLVPARRAFRRGDADEGIRVFGATLLGPGGFERLPDERKAQVLDNLSATGAELLGSGLAPLDPGALRRLEVPTLLITGRRSVGLFRRLAFRVRDLLPRAELVELAHATHRLHEDEPREFERAVRAFLDRHRAG